MKLPEAVVELIRQRFSESVPLNRALGLRLVEADTEYIVSELPYDARLIGNPETGFLHGGAITTQLDATCGMAVPIKMKRAVAIATLDLRIDYLKPATPGESVFCRASCFRTTRNVAFVRGTADCGDPDDPIASAAGTFVIFGSGGSPVGPDPKKEGT